MLLIRRVRLDAEQISTDPRARRRRTIPKEQLALALGGQADEVYGYSFILTNLTVPRCVTCLGRSRGQHHLDVGCPARHRHHSTGWLHHLASLPSHDDHRTATPNGDARDEDDQRQGVLRELGVREGKAHDRHLAPPDRRHPRAGDPPRRTADPASTPGDRDLLVEVLTRLRALPARS